MVNLKILFEKFFGKDIKFTLFVFLVSRAVFFIPAIISLYFFLPYRGAPPPGHHLYHEGSQHPIFLVNLVQKWDAYWFINVAREGYYWQEVAVIGENNNDIFKQATNVTVFPLLPVLMKIFSFGFMDISIIGILICNISFFIGLVFLLKLLKNYIGIDNAQRTILYLSFFPLAFIYSSIYSESLFVLFSVLTFYFMEKQKYWTAGLCSMLLTTSRLLGIIIIPTLLVWLFLDYIKNKKISKGFFIPLIFSVAGILLFSLWIWHISGHWDGYFVAQTAWKKSVDYPWNLIKHLIFVFQQNGLDIYKIIPDAFFILPILLFSVWKFSKVPVPMSTFWVVGLVLALCSTSMVGFPRYVSTLFPMFIPLAQLGEKKWIHWLILVIFVSVGNFCVIGWTNWYFSF